MIGRVAKLVFFSLFHVADLTLYVLLLLRLSSSSSSSSTFYSYVLPASCIIGVAAIAASLHVLHDVKLHRGLLPTLPGGVGLWLAASILCAIPPASLALSLPFFLLRGVVGSVGRDFRSSLVVVSNDAADAQFCLRAFLQSAPLLALNTYHAASLNRVSAPLLLATLSSLLHVYVGIFMGRSTNVQLYFAWFFVDRGKTTDADANGADDAAPDNPRDSLVVKKPAKKLRLCAALISVFVRFWCVLVVATCFFASALYASHRHPAFLVSALLAGPHLFFLCFEVVWKLFAHRLLFCLQNTRRRAGFVVFLFFLCVATSCVNGLASAAWIVDVKRSRLELPSRFCKLSRSPSSSHVLAAAAATTTADSLATDAEGNRRRRVNDYVAAGIPAFVWPDTVGVIDSLAVCFSSYFPAPEWSRCEERTLFRNGTLVGSRRWWNRVDWTRDVAAMWNDDGGDLFCLSHVAEPLFICLFYANACQIVVLFALLLVFGAWKLIIAAAATAKYGGGGGGGGGSGGGRGGDNDSDFETSFGARG